MTAREPLSAWDDARIAAAFRARFDQPAPANLAARMRSELLRSRRAPSLPTWFRTAIAGIAAVALVLVIVIAGTRLPVTGPGASPTSGATSPSPSLAPDTNAPASETETPIAALFPATVPDPGTSAPIAVTSVDQAVGVRDSGVDTATVAVGGWFVRNVVPCAAHPGNSPLESCVVDFTWLMAAPEQLSVTDASGAGSIHQPVGPAINVVTDFRAAHEGTPEAVVLIGHFDDAQSSACAVLDVQLCRDRFVATAVAWTAETLPEWAPSYLDDFTVRSVADVAGARREVYGLEVAVGGYFDASLPPLGCTKPIGISPLLDGCTNPWQFLMAHPEAIHTGLSGETVRTPTGPSLAVTFDGIPALVPDLALGATTDYVPQQVVLIGHFHDRRATLCQADLAQQCGDRFVVDAVAWINGHALPIPVAVDLREPGNSVITVTQQAKVRAFLANPGVYQVLATITVPGDRLTRIEPGITAETGIDLQSILVLIHTVAREPSTDSPDAFVVDSTGQFWTDTGPSWGLSGLNP